MYSLHVLKLLFNNLITSGLFVAVALTVLEVISKRVNLVGFYAFTSASFFLINLMQYYKLRVEKSITKYNFLVHTTIGGIVWVGYTLLMYLLYKYNFSTEQNIAITLIIYILVTAVYFYFTTNNKLNFKE